MAAEESLENEREQAEEQPMEKSSDEEVPEAEGKRQRRVGFLDCTAFMSATFISTLIPQYIYDCRAGLRRLGAAAAHMYRRQRQ